jgi:hypothetical protein
MKQIKHVVMATKNAVNDALLKPFVALQVGVMALPAFAADQKFDMPSVTIPGASEDADPIDLAVSGFRFLGQMVLWVLVLIAGFVVVKNIVKSVNKARKDEDAQWGAVVGDVLGNVVFLVLLIAIATWVNGFLAAPEA